jgi:hypothetical protein
MMTAYKWVGQLVPKSVRRGLRDIASRPALTEAAKRRNVPAAELAAMFEALRDLGTSYVVMRWFETLPAAPERDIDFLVADDSLQEFEAALPNFHAGVPLDIYSETAVPGYRHRGLAYFPPSMARQILARRVYYRGLVSVPCDYDYFLSLAYHCVYYKGTETGLPTRASLPGPLGRPKRDYARRLAELAERSGVRVDISLEGLEQFLASEGWRPATPALKRLARDNAWLKHRFAGGNSIATIGQAGVRIGSGAI